MFTRLRSTWFAGTGAIVLVLSLSGAVLGASVLTATTGPTPEVELDPLVVDTSLTFEDVDGDGIDDDCETGVVADQDAAAAAEAAVDLDGDGAISVSEAAQSDRTGGKNCNHGGYVSLVAQATCDTEDEAATEDPAPPVEVLAEPEPEDESEEGAEAEDESADCEDTEDAAAPAAEDAECVAVAAPTFDPATMTGPGAFGAYVALVAQSDAVGGKNCNHGGAVSEAVKAAKAVVKAEREAARAAAKAERDAAKAEREAARAERATQRAAAKAERGQSQGKGKGH